MACYRDALMLFLNFASYQLGKTPSSLRLIDIRPELILAFLDHLEQERHNGVRSRNLRLTALRAFLKFAGRRDVTALHVVEQALGGPMKRFERPMLGYLTREEMVAVLGHPGESWSSQRDHLLLATLSPDFGLRAVLAGSFAIRSGKRRASASISSEHVIRIFYRLACAKREIPPFSENHQKSA